ncbi:hypothetical protein LWI28_021858 [Acer negundo]|uniref:Uncharacterized protein n=1 Tax=Acer negundo TaxID=4023 RepID=A0AAD5NM59_ACENE|nr:hypothetical protein LWI28_021858 [Acer negundo]
MTDPKDSSSTNSTSDSQGSNFSAQGPNDSFFVHLSDNPTAVLVSPMLSGDNYNNGTDRTSYQRRRLDWDVYVRKSTIFKILHLSTLFKI